MRGGVLPGGFFLLEAEEGEGRRVKVVFCVCVYIMRNGEAFFQIMVIVK